MDRDDDGELDDDEVDDDDVGVVDDDGDGDLVIEAHVAGRLSAALVEEAKGAHPVLVQKR